MMICLLAEDVLLLQTVTLAQCLEHVVPDIHVGIVLIRIGTPLLYRILYLEDRRRIAVPGIQDGIRDMTFRVGDVLDAGKKAVKNLFLATHSSCLLLHDAIARRGGCRCRYPDAFSWSEVLSSA